MKSKIFWTIKAEIPGTNHKWSFLMSTIYPFFNTSPAIGLFIQPLKDNSICTSINAISYNLETKLYEIELKEYNVFSSTNPQWNVNKETAGKLKSDLISLKQELIFSGWAVLDQQGNFNE